MAEGLAEAFLDPAMAVLSVYSMLKAGDGLGDALNGDYSEKEKAEKFGKAAGAMYGSITIVMQPKILESIVGNTRETVRMKFTELKSFVKIFTVRDVGSMLSYCGEFVSGPALADLKEAVQGWDVKQL